MAKRKSKGRFPGSIYVPKGRKHLRVKVKNPDFKKEDPVSQRYVVLTTGLPDTPTGWKHAEELLERFWLQRKGLVPPPPDQQPMQLTFQEIWDKYAGIRGKQMLPQSLHIFKRGYFRIVTDTAKVFNKANCLEFIHTFIATNRLAKSTVNCYLRSVKQVINWASRNDLFHEQLDIAQYYYTLEEKENKYFTRDECLNLFIYFWNKRRKQRRKKSQRNDREFALLLEIMWSTGARISDMLTLSWAQVDFETSVISWKNKMTKKTESVPVSPKVMQALSVLRNITPTREMVFRWRLTARVHLREWLLTAMADLGIEANGRCFHSFRKTFCNKVFTDLNLPIQLSLVLVRHKTVDVTIKNYLAKDYSQLHTALNRLR